MTAADGFLQSFYRFNVYYQIRRILVEIQAALPLDQAWDAVNNPYDRQGYERIYDEFGVYPHSSYWKVKGPSWGLGRVYTHWDRHSEIYALGEEEYDPSDMSFTKKRRRRHSPRGIHQAGCRGSRQGLEDFNTQQDRWFHPPRGREVE